MDPMMRIASQKMNKSLPISVNNEKFVEKIKQPCQSIMDEID